ncbi:hypothetical protein C8F04DRAFT_1397448 [Mycena alexandri]|uniref:Uncharacterized protein n=1 Tax=Mycena alexandri TaxID=1745969 RepID=A0AAD6X0B3_9AGAR|nr:hypothetical protein C8F04DRAFT_1397448 [Mycena alexandri]
MSGNATVPQLRPDFSALSEPVAIEDLFDALDLDASFLEFESRTTSSGTGPFSRLIHPMIVTGITEGDLANRIENYLRTTHGSNLPATFYVVIREAGDQFEVLISRGNGGGVRVQWTRGNRARAAIAPLPIDIPRGLPIPGPISPNVGEETLRFWEDVLLGLDFTAHFNSVWGHSPSAMIHITNPAHEDAALARINTAVAAFQRGALPSNETIYPVSIQRADGTPFFRPTEWDVPLLDSATCIPDTDAPDACHPQFGWVDQILRNQSVKAALGIPSPNNLDYLRIDMEVNKEFILAGDFTTFCFHFYLPPRPEYFVGNTPHITLSIYLDYIDAQDANCAWPGVFSFLKLLESPFQKEFISAFDVAWPSKEIATVRGCWKYMTYLLVREAGHFLQVVYD